MAAPKPLDMDEYISAFPAETQAALQQVRQAIHAAAPQAAEGISYGMPAFNLNGKYLLYFAGYKKHVGVYPVPSGDKTFEKDFAAYQTSGKGAIQFPLDKAMPIALIKKIVRFRMRQQAEKISPAAKKAVKKAGKS